MYAYLLSLYLFVVAYMHKSSKIYLDVETSIDANPVGPFTYWIHCKPADANVLYDYINALKASAQEETFRISTKGDLITCSFEYLNDTAYDVYCAGLDCLDKNNNKDISIYVDGKNIIDPHF